MKQFTKASLIKNFRDNPKVFYIYYIVMLKGLPSFQELVVDEKSLNELLAYKSLYANKHHDDHKYNLTKNTFWNKSGFNSWLKNKLEE